MLYSCIFVPRFAVQAAIRNVPMTRQVAWQGSPVAIYDGPDALPRIFACNEKAEIAGIQIGHTKAQAAQCPGMVLRKREIKREREAQEALLDCAFSFSPRVEATAEGIVILDISGTDRIFGPPEKLARNLAEQVSRVGLEANVATASSPEAALIAAKAFSGTSVIHPGKEAASIAQVPVDVLPLTQSQAEILDSWGIRTCRDLLLLPPVPLNERLGRDGVYLQKVASGQSSRPLVPIDPPTRFQESIELEEALTTLEPLLISLEKILEHISARLLSRSLATDELRLRLGLEVHQDRDVKENSPLNVRIVAFERILKLPVAVQDSKILLNLLGLELAQHGPDAPVKTIELEAQAAKRRVTQHGLFAALAPEPEKLEIVLARIRGIVGDTDEQGRGRIGSPEVLDSHRHDDFRMKAPYPNQPERKPQKLIDGDGSLTMSMFRPPLKARVLCKSGRPSHISFAEVASPVISLAGPWSTSGSWWKQDAQWRREEWDIAIQLPNGIGLYRIFRDVIENAWFVEGLYD